MATDEESKLSFDREKMSTTEGYFSLPMRRKEPGRVEGYWADLQDTYTFGAAVVYPLPTPNPKPWPGQVAFISKLQAIQMTTKRDGTTPGIGLVAYDGDSLCRICKKRNGCSEYVSGSDKLLWPDGFLHYVEAHNVKPSKEFYDWVMQYKC